jgi:hypothetical protein
VAVRRPLLSRHNLQAQPCSIDTASHTRSSTHEEIAALQPLLKARGVRRLILVTDGAHMRRAMGWFETPGSVWPAELARIAVSGTPHFPASTLRAALSDVRPAAPDRTSKGASPSR